ncbi:MAG: hypothetical protein M1839_001713 [Geoglossum umbratile]|nr:MAG: hypothetical protein M1839_001713 [Geoglossum umbratile]
MEVGLTREAYTVGWICALPKELAAAMAMLDDLHPPLPQLPDDNNSYTLGRIGDHNVVIACVAGERSQKKNYLSCHDFADQMRRGFRLVRFGLMVGIGGGVPSAGHDIRLGDVVVSKPGMQNGGVIQYDFGKVEKEGKFIYTGSLCTPPKMLLAALSKLQAVHAFQGNQLAQYTSTIKPLMRQQGFQYQGVEYDLLFEAEYDHVGDNPTCEKCEVGKLVKRPDRESADPVVHYGMIASGNQVMKHGGIRDRLSREFGMLCFEMEAAGLMDNFPCIVIRGVCDYADSHKNKWWQEYAAATAAAYAKELLSIIPAMETAAVSDQRGIRNEHYHVPRNVSSMFTGRDEVCKLLREQCLPSESQSRPRVHKVFVLYGLGGSGKTQVCLKFAQDHREKFWGVFWIDASSNETAEQGYLEIAEACGFEKRDFEATKRRLSNVREPWLLIVDNADDPSINVSRYFPTGDRGTILVTTRNRNCQSHQTVGSWEFGDMLQEEAVALLLKTASAEDHASDSLRTSARNIVEDLGCLALAISQAGAFIRENHYTMEEYRKEYSYRRKMLLSRQPSQASSDYEYSVYTTWEVSVRMIAEASNETSRNAMEVLQFFSFLHFEGVSEEILKNSWTNSRKYQYLKWTLSKTLSMLHHGESLDWDPYPLREAFRKLLLPHIEFCLSFHDGELFPNGAEGHLSVVAGFVLTYRESYRPEKAKQLQEKVVEVMKRIHGEDDLTTLSSVYSLAAIYGSLGQDEEAKRLLEKVVEAQERILGEGHLETALSVYSLAVSYQNLGRFEEAEHLFEKVIEVQQRALGENHPYTLTSVQSLAVSYQRLGRFEEAEQLLKKVIEVQKRTLGENHSYTLSSVHSLAASYQCLGRFEEVKQLLEEAVDVQKRTLGENYPHTLSSAHNLALCYQKLGRYEEAKQLLDKVTETQIRVLGKDHPDTLHSMRSLALVNNHQGPPAETAPLKEDTRKAPFDEGDPTIERPPERLRSLTHHHDALLAPYAHPHTTGPHPSPSGASSS